MIHINKTKKGNFIVQNVAANGEILKSSEPLKSKANCFKNIRAEMKDCHRQYDYVTVQDNTGVKPKEWNVGLKKKVLRDGKF
jgi:uncharacterized protein YegP (UPF0339 family)